MHIPEGVTNDDVAEALVEMLELRKALKNPASPPERARARKAFLALQRDFEDTMVPMFDTLEGTSTLLREIAVTTADNFGKKKIDTLLERLRQNTRAALNPVVKQTYIRAFELGLRAGGATRGMLPNEEEIVDRMRANEYAYVDQFITDVGYAEGTMPYAQRATMYANAVEETYWLGYVYSDLSGDRYLRWVMHSSARGFKETEHCPDCAWIVGDLDQLEEDGVLEDLGITAQEARRQGAGGRWGNGVYTAQELAQMAVAPQSGSLTCTTHCKCHLQPAEKPKRAPMGKVAEWQSIAPKPFTGTNETADGKVVVTRENIPKQRAGYAKRAKRAGHVHVKRT